MTETVTYRVSHTSKLFYAAPVAQARFNLRLRPYQWPGQRIISQSLQITPEPAVIIDEDGPYLINTTRIGFQEPLGELDVTSEFVVEITPPALPDTPLTVGEVRAQAIASRDLTVHSPAPYLFASRIAGLDGAIADWAEPFLAHDRNIIDAAMALTTAVHDKIAYKPGSSTSRTAPHDAFAAESGVCQDQSHVMIAALRAHSIPAAYISGYLNTLQPPGQEKLVGADAMHAWVSVWCGEGVGWVCFDPTNNKPAGGDHVVVGMGRDFADVSPIDGVFLGSANQRLKYAVDVRQVEDATV